MSSFAALLTAAWVAGLPQGAEAEWPQFRGPGGAGHSKATGLPLTWSETENVAWKVSLPGCAWSSPVILGNQVWTTTAHVTLAPPEEAAKKFSANPRAEFMAVARRISLEALCVDRGTGELLRQIRLFDIEDPPPIESLNSYASPTPVVESGRVYCDFGNLGTVCLDAAGDLLWERHLPVDHQVGPGSSPVLHKDLLILFRDGVDSQYISALDKRTGRTVWKTNHPPLWDQPTFMRKAFSTPLLIEHDGHKQMVAPRARWCASYDPDTGEEIWRVNFGRGYNVVPRPVFGHGMVYFCTGFRLPELWAVRVDGRGDVTETHVAWKATKQIPKIPSPILVGDELYIISDTGVATCFDARTGEVHWTKRISGNYCASPISADGWIGFFSQEGKATLLRPGKTPVTLATNQLDGRFMASPAIAGRALFLRTATHLYRIEKP